MIGEIKHKTLKCQNNERNLVPAVSCENVHKTKRQLNDLVVTTLKCKTHKCVVCAQKVIDVVIHPKSLKHSLCQELSPVERHKNFFFLNTYLIKINNAGEKNCSDYLNLVTKTFDWAEISNVMKNIQAQIFYFFFFACKTFDTNTKWHSCIFYGNWSCWGYFSLSLNGIWGTQGCIPLN